MKDRELAFNREKHVLYSKDVKEVIRKHLESHYDSEQIEAIWEQIQLQYVKFLETLPFLGGKKNSQARGVYDSIMLFAYYEAVPDKPSMEEFEQMNNETFVPAFASLGKFVNMNWKWVQRVEHYVFRSIEKQGNEHAKDWPGNYVMKVEPYDKEKGIRYVFTRCPIAEFAKKHGYLHLMPALCNPDYPMMEAAHGALIRKDTCAKGTTCDYWIVGDKSPYLEEHPRMRDDAGYEYNA